MNRIKKNLLVLISIIGVSNINCQSNWNLNFENWEMADSTPNLWHDTLVVENRVGLFPPKWHYDQDNIPEGRGLGQTTDVTEGNYAVALSGFYQYEKMRIISGENPMNPGWPIDYKPVKLTGDYKAILLGDCDSLRTTVKITLKSFNVNTQQSEIVAESEVILNETNEYTEFNLDLNYSTNLEPDTVIIELSKRRYGSDIPPDCLECSHVFFDNLELHNSTTEIEESPAQFNFIVSPNPAKDYILLTTDFFNSKLKYSSSTITGKILINGKIESSRNRIELNQLPAGIYTLTLLNESQEILTTKIFTKL